VTSYVYIVSCRDCTFYTVWTNVVVRRMNAHNEGKGSRYTRTRRPVDLVYIEECANKSEALRREREIKKMPRTAKQCLAEEFHAFFLPSSAGWG
jgi:putative endonuclease